MVGASEPTVLLRGKSAAKPPSSRSFRLLFRDIAAEMSRNIWGNEQAYLTQGMKYLLGGPPTWPFLIREVEFAF